MSAFTKNCKRILAAVLAAVLVIAAAPAAVSRAAGGSLAGVQSATARDNIVTLTFAGGIKGRITFLEGNIFRYNVDPSGVFSEYATTVYGNSAKIPQYPDSYDAYSHPGATVSEAGGYIVIEAGETTIRFEKSTAKMTVSYNDKVVMQEQEALSLGSDTVQTLVKNEGEDFFGGGTQNGRFIHTGESIHIANESDWVDGGVSSPSPFYYSTSGYGVLRNTFLPGVYDFGKTQEGTVRTVHSENEFDAYFFLSDGENAAEVVQDLLGGYYHVTGDPVLLPEYAFYEGHLNAYNRDSWTDTEGTGGWVIYGSNSHDGSEGVLTAYQETGQATGYVIPEGAHAESLNGSGPTVSAENFPATADTPYEFSARAVIDQYVAMDMPLGYFLPNDGYGAGYGQNGYYVTGGVNADGTSTPERIAAVDANVQNLKEFTDYAREHGIEVGLWTQSDLTPDSDYNTYWHLLRDFGKEVTVGGVTTLKTDVAWVGYGYDMALNAQQTGYNTVSTGLNYRPNLISLDGWAGTQRFAGIWTGDQYGGNWEYIRFHIPTYIGQSLSGNPNIGSDMDGIFSGDAIISTRDTQWKTFTPTMLNMDGWGSYAKTPYTFGDPYTGINRMYLKLKAQLMPYIYTSAASASGIDTGNGDTDLPMIRAMFLEFPEDSYAATKNMQYQYLFGGSILVAPVYTQTDAIDELGNDVRNGIYLPGEDQIWIDYFTGDQYYGGQVLNNFDAPIWKLPVFVKNGAIIPMWEENNSPAGIDRANRIAEFWPAGSTEYTLYEDEGTFMENKQTQVEGYGTVNEISYGDHVSTRYTSVVENGTATLTAEASTGTYNGYERNKNTTFIVNVSGEPTAVTARNGSRTLTMVRMNSAEEVLNARLSEGQFAYFYDAAPAIETYAQAQEDEFAAMMEGRVSAPKLYVKFAETDSQANAQTLILEGFENVDAGLSVNAPDASLAVPTDLRDVADRKTPTANVIAWDAVEGALSYDVLVDGIVNNVGNVTTFVHTDQEYHSTHTYAVRARGPRGWSEWTAVMEATTLHDPWRNVPAGEVTWNGGDLWGALANATDHDTSTMFHSSGDVVANAEPFIFDFGAAYELDKFEYYPRDNYGNGTVYQMDIFVSLDGVHWKQVHAGAEDIWSYDHEASCTENVKTVDLSGHAARFVKLIVRESAGSFFSANELVVYKRDGTNAFAVGSTGFLSAVSEADYSNMNNYKGTSVKDGSIFVDQIQKRHGDINYNGIYDVYDYAFTAFPQDGGTKKTGAVSGGASYEVTVRDGEVVILVMAEGVRNVNAFGQVLSYDPAKLSFVSAKTEAMASSMVDFTVNKVYDDGTAYLNLACFNKGDQPLLNGSGALATITMRGTDPDAIDLSSLMLIGPDYSLKTAEATVSGGSDTVIYGQSDVRLTMTNGFLSTDDGSNVTKLIQQGSYDGLFDGVFSRDFEFLWDYAGNWDDSGTLPEFVTLPVTIHISLSEPSGLTDVTLYNANRSNGYATRAEAVLHYSDGTDSERLVIALTEMTDYAPFAFTWADNGKTVASADITILEAIDGYGAVTTNMLTLAELELRYEKSPAAHEHSYEAVVTAPTCTEPGYTAYTCSCGDSYTADETAPLGHAWKGIECERCDATRENPFVDVPNDSFCIDPVLWAVEKGITTGTSSTAFDPNGKCARAIVVTFLWRAAGSPEPTATENPFTDVKESDFYYKAVLWAVEKGITTGTSATTFDPGALCNRATVVTFLYRAMGSPAVESTGNPFSDVKVSSWYGPAVLWAVEKGITNGMGGGLFGVGATCTRAQVVTFLYRTLA